MRDRDVVRNGKRYRVLRPRVQKPRIEIYQEARKLFVGQGRNEWRWRLVGANGKILADSGEGYTRKADVKRALGLVLEAISLARIVEV